MKWPTVSIIIPCYNYQQYILDTLYSCRVQNYPGLEIIIVDDCSTDSSYRILNEERKARTDFTLLKTRTNSGYSAAKNYGIRNSTGEFIATLDADDMLTPLSIKTRALALMQNEDVGFVHGKAYLIWAAGGYEYYVTKMNLGKGLSIHSGVKVNAQTTMIRRSVHLKYGLYDENLRSRSDNEMWYRLRTVCGVKDLLIENPPVAFYRKHELSMIQYRKKNPSYNNDVTLKLLAAKEMRTHEGVNSNNTPWLVK